MNVYKNGQFVTRQERKDNKQMKRALLVGLIMIIAVVVYCLVTNTVIYL